MNTIKTIYRNLDRAENLIHRGLKILGALALIVAFFSIVIQVSYRYVICKFVVLPVSFTEELSRFCLYWIIYLMLPVVVKEGLESTNTFLPDRAKGAAKLILFIAVRCICIFVAYIALKYSFVVLGTNATYHSPAMRIPGLFIYLPVTIGMILVFVRYAIEALGLICGELHPFESMHPAEEEA